MILNTTPVQVDALGTLVDASSLRVGDYIYDGFASKDRRIVEIRSFRVNTELEPTCSCRH